MNNKKHYINYLILFFSPTCLFAEIADNTLAFLGSEEMYLEDMPIVISATKLEQPLNEAPVATTIIDRQMIDASGAQTIPDLLRLVPGFTVGYLSGANPVATYHGQSDRYSKRVQLLIDGRSVYLPTLAGVAWSDLIIGIEDIERIEVVRGPNASTYGNNAFQTVVSISTKHASDNDKHFFKSTAGSHDTANAIYRFSGRNGDLDYRVSLGTKNNEGTDLLDDFTDTDYFSYRMDYQIDTSTQLFYSGGIQNSTYGDVLETATDTSNSVDVDTAFQHLKLEHNFDNQSSLSVQYYYNYTRSFDFNILVENFTPAIFALTSPTIDFSAIDPFDVNLQFKLESERHDLEVDYYYNLGDSLRLVSGASVRADKITADSSFDPESDNIHLLYRAFTHGEYRLTDDWIFNTGLMVESNDISGTDFSPRLALIHHLNNKHTLRLSASKATRTPTLFDENGFVNLEHQLTQDGGQPLNNPDLQAALGGDILTDTIFYSTGDVDSEEIISYELGWISQLLNNKLTLDIKLFVDETENIIYENRIYNVPTETIDALDPLNLGNDAFNGAIDNVNAASTRTRGIEITTDYQISSDWRLYAYYAYIELDAKVTNPDITRPAEIIGRYEESIPSNSYGTMLMKQWDSSLNTSLAIYHVNDMDWLDRTHSRISEATEGFKDRSAEAYTRVDFVLRKSIIKENSQVDLSLILQNLNGSYFDYSQTSYTDNTFQTVNIPGSEQDPRGYIELAIKFN